MLILKTNPAGVDVPIQKVQQFLHDRLLPLWGLVGDPSKYRAYGRCYRNKLEYGYVAENYEGNEEYKEVYWDDSLTAISFFGIGSQIAHELASEKSTVHLVFFLDLKKVKPAIAHRADEEVHRDLLRLLGAGAQGLAYTGLDTGIDYVLREYPGSRRDKRLIAVDMHPVHCFRLNFELLYDINNC